MTERGATVPSGDLLAVEAPGGRPAEGPPSREVLDAQREERL